MRSKWAVIQKTLNLTGQIDRDSSDLAASCSKPDFKRFMTHEMFFKTERLSKTKGGLIERSEND